MNNRMLVAMFAVTGMTGVDVARAESPVCSPGSGCFTRLAGSSWQDLAQRFTPATGSGTMLVGSRLRRTQNDQPGYEQPGLALFGDGIHGIFVSRQSSPIGGTLPASSNGDNNDQVQGGMIPFVLQAQTDGSIAAILDTTNPAKFITAHRAQNDRTFNQPNVYSVGTNLMVVEYNYRPNNRTYRYMQVYALVGTGATAQVKPITMTATFSENGTTHTSNGATNASRNGGVPEVEVYRQNNDDCSMNQDGHMGTVTNLAATGATTTAYLSNWRGCNGNGNDNGWQTFAKVNVDTTALTGSDTQQFDVALCQQEERSRGNCTASAADQNTVMCSQTEGNNQPQRDGVWLAAVDVTPGKYTGNDVQKAILWK